MQTYNGSADGRSDLEVPLQVDSEMPESIQIGVINKYLDENLATLSYDDMCEVAREARSLRDFSNIVIGRVALEIDQRHGEEEAKKALVDFSRQLQLQVETVYQYKWVASKFPNLRNYDGLSFSYYRIAAGTEDPEGWIKQAVDNNWTVSMLQQKVKGRPLMVECEHKDVEKIYIEKCKDCGKTLLKTKITTD